MRNPLLRDARAKCSPARAAVFLAEGQLGLRNGNQMSRLSEGLSREKIQQSQSNTVPPDMVPADLALPESAEATEAPNSAMPKTNGSREMGETKKVLKIEKARSVTIQPPPASRLVAWTDPNSLGAEKFRALAVRLSNIRAQNELNSLQVTSSVINEGKTFVAANLAVTLAKHLGSRTLLIEGDLHRPTLAPLFGLKELQGLSDWWSGREQDISHFLV